MCCSIIQIPWKSALHCLSVSPIMTSEKLFWIFKVEYKYTFYLCVFISLIKKTDSFASLYSLQLPYHLYFRPVAFTITMTEQSTNTQNGKLTISFFWGAWWTNVHFIFWCWLFDLCFFGHRSVIISSCLIHRTIVHHHFQITYEIALWNIL